MSDLFDIAENPDISRRDLRAACLAWLMSQEAMGLATQVPTRITNYRADIAAFWSEAGRNPEDMGPSRILHPTQTMVIEYHPYNYWDGSLYFGASIQSLYDLGRR